LDGWSGTQICIKYSVPDAVPPIHAESYHVATDKDPSKSGLFLATVYNQLQLAERKHVARYWSISAVPVSTHPSPLVITMKLVAAILVVAVVRRRGSAGNCPCGLATSRIIPESRVEAGLTSGCILGYLALLS